MADTPTLDELIASAQSGDSTPSETTTNTTTEPATNGEAADLSAATPAVTEPAGDTPAEGADADAKPEEGGDDGDFFTSFQEQYGIDLSGKYKTPDEALRGLAEAYHAVGRRDDDAAYGRALRNLVQGKEQQLQAFLAGGQPQAAPAQAKTGQTREIEDFPDDAANWRYQITTDDKGNYIPAPGAPANVVQDYKDYLAARERRLDQVARSYKNLQNIPKQVEQQLGTLQQQAAQQEEQRTIGELQTRYAKALFVNGQLNGNGEGVLTADGRRVETEFRRLRDDPHVANAPNSWCFQEALRRVFGEANKGGAAKPKAAAVRTPGVATPAAKTYPNVEAEISERMRAGEDMVKILTEIHGRNGAKLG